MLPWVNSNPGPSVQRQMAPGASTVNSYTPDRTLHTVMSREGLNVPAPPNFQDEYMKMLQFAQRVPRAAPPAGVQAQALSSNLAYRPHEQVQENHPSVRASAGPGPDQEAAYVSYPSGPGQMGGPIKASGPGPGNFFSGYVPKGSGPQNTTVGGMMPESRAALSGSPAIPATGSYVQDSSSRMPGMSQADDWWSLPESLRNQMLSNPSLYPGLRPAGAPAARGQVGP